MFCDNEKFPGGNFSENTKGIPVIKLLFFRLFLAIGARLPLSLLQAVAHCLGGLLLRIRGRAAETTLRNLRTCFPERDEDAVRKLARASLQHSLCALFEMGRAWRWPLPKLQKLLRESAEVAEFRRAAQSGSGVILLAPHLGNWEIFGISMCYGLPSSFLYAPPGSAAFDALLRASRERGGLRMAAAGKAGVAQLARALGRGEVIGILPDQVPADGSGEFAPFFGEPAYTMTLAARLAQRPGVRVFCGYAERLPRAEGFRIHMGELDLRRERLSDSLAAMNRAVEDLARQCPEQYQWEYKRFRRRPDGAEFYQEPAP